MGRVLTYANIMQNAEIIKWNNNTTKWSEYCTMTTIKTSENDKQENDKYK
jgi:hypothetical protein